MATLTAGRALIWLMLCVGLSCAALPALADERRVIGGKGVQVHYWPEHEEQALLVRSEAEHALPILADTLGLQFSRPVRIDIVRSHREMVELAGSRVPTWTRGLSLHHANHVILKPQTQKQMQRLVMHELTHVALDLKMQASHGEAPRWVHEGLAQWMEGEMPAVQKDILGTAAVEGRLLALDELEDAFRGDRETVDLAYAQSHVLVAYLVEHGPPGAVGNFLEALEESGDERRALRRAAGIPLDALQERWIKEIRTEYAARGVPLSVELLVFGAMGLLFIAAVVVRLRMAREIRERMQSEERFEQLMAQLELLEEPNEDDERESERP
ncbi:MAG: hypothetical protein HPY44_03105 [Armatimonadetes bacterium]|nr:hypothetical protein [Armatimonadota bacterium]